MRRLIRCVARLAAVAVIAGPWVSTPAPAATVTDCQPSPAARVACPGTCADCLQDCQGQICVTYETFVDGTNTRIDGPVQIEWRASTVPALTPALGPPAPGGGFTCRPGFNAGTGYVEFTSTTGTTKRLDGTTFPSTILAGCPAALQTLAATSNCTTWTQAQRDRFKELCLDHQAEGWDIAWACQENEPGSGWSVSGLASPDIIMSGIDLAFSIGFYCTCDGASAPVPINFSHTGP